MYINWTDLRVSLAEDGLGLTFTFLCNILPAVMPGCFIDAAGDLDDECISRLEFFKKCLVHFGPTDPRVTHTEHEASIENQVSSLVQKSRLI